MYGITKRIQMGKGRCDVVLDDGMGLVTWDGVIRDGVSNQNNRKCFTQKNALFAWVRTVLHRCLLPNELHYIHSNQTLPPPLSAAEEQIVFSRLVLGEEGAKTELITHNLRLVVYIAKKFESSGVAVEDIISIGSIGLIKAVNTFSPEKNIKLATYASRCIENEILMYLRKTSNRRQEASIDEPLNVDGDGNELLLSDILGSDANLISQHLEQEAEHSVLRRAVNRLNPRERQIMEMRFGLAGKREKTQKEVADEIGISQSYISRLEKRIIKTLRLQLEQEGV